jgi:hypothetical protein
MRLNLSRIQESSIRGSAAIHSTPERTSESFITLSSLSRIIVRCTAFLAATERGEIGQQPIDAEIPGHGDF